MKTWLITAVIHNLSSREIIIIIIVIITITITITITNSNGAVHSVDSDISYPVIHLPVHSKTNINI